MACQTYLSMIELQQISRVDTQIISPQSGKAIIHPIMDNVLGTFLLTNPNNEISFLIKQSLLPILNSFQTLNKIDKPLKGLEMLQNEFPFISPNMGKSQIKNAVKWMYRTKSPSVCVDFLNRIQTITNMYLKLYGYSIGYDDIRISPEIHKFKNETIKKAKKNVKQYLKEIYEKQIKITKADVELKIFNDLNRTRDEIGQMVMSKITKNNSFFTIIKSGAKGNILNISQILGTFIFFCFLRFKVAININNKQDQWVNKIFNVKRKTAEFQ